MVMDISQKELAVAVVYDAAGHEETHRLGSYGAFIWLRYTNM